MGEVLSVAFRPDGRTVASTSWDRTIKLWNVTTGAERETLEGHAYSVEAVAFSPDGKTLASGSRDKTIKLWEVGSGDAPLTLRRHTDSVTNLAFSRDGRTLASAGGEVKLCDVADGKELASLHRLGAHCLAFSPDGSMLALGCDDDTVKVWGVVLRPRCSK
jgi:WD40 repeat protein